MKGRICLCPASIAWIRKHLMKSARRTFTKMISTGSIKRVAHKVRKGKRPRFTPRIKSFGHGKRPTKKQIAARKLFVKRVRRGDFRRKRRR